MLRGVRSSVYFPWTVAAGGSSITASCGATSSAGHHKLARRTRSYGTLFELRLRRRRRAARARVRRPSARPGDRARHRPLPEVLRDVLRPEFTGLLERGWDVHVLCNRSNQDQWPLLPASCADDARERASGSTSSRDFEAQLAELQPDVVHFGYGTLALGRMHMRDDARLQGRRQPPRLRHQLLRARRPALSTTTCGTHADMLNLVSEDVWKRAQRRGCPPDKPHRVITDAIDVSRFAAPQRALRGGRHRRAAAAAAERRAAALEEGPRVRRSPARARADRRAASTCATGSSATARIASRSCSRSTTSGSSEHVELPGARRADDVQRGDGAGPTSACTPPSRRASASR